MRRILTILTVMALPMLACGAAGASPDGKSDFVPLDVPTLASRMIGKDTAIASEPVRFGRMGRLTAAVTLSNSAGAPPLQAGQPMFGLWMTSPAGVNDLVWCALRPDARPKAPAPWETLCLLPGPEVRAWMRVPSPLLLPLSLAAGRAATSPDGGRVEPGPVDFGHPLILTYALRQFENQAADIELYLSVEGYERWIGRLGLPREADGTVLLPLANGVLRLTQAGADRRAYTAAWVVEPKAGP